VGSSAAVTHDWELEVDAAHLQAVRDEASVYVRGGMVHLVLEVLAYAADEAEALGRQGWCRVVLHRDGSVSVEDDGRGTEVRRDASGAVIRKPVMATKDLRFFDPGHEVYLPDGWVRRGMSVVAAVSLWLEHENRRADGSWIQRYEYGIPVTALLPLAAASSTGTFVRFQIDRDLVDEDLPVGRLLELAKRFHHLAIHVVRE
jgi:DNA gyrase subunit B